ncbi:hypothetical protein K7X08_012522 [Anisodus acutangulus]|uniref:SUI1 domain-containing protein n=1 Tax=Anisodus acutangulus TaxID=402998 RepID=A0A9Q1QZ60_9SOLA|nr:hypothetical protein K7X08_012522 [Anisodus acutangulus]
MPPRESKDAYLGSSATEGRNDIDTDETIGATRRRRSTMYSILFFGIMALVIVLSTFLALLLGDLSGFSISPNPNLRIRSEHPSFEICVLLLSSTLSQVSCLISTSKFLPLLIPLLRQMLITLGLKKEFSYNKILKDLKKEFCCNGTVVQDPELGQVIQLQGDQRKNVSTFLIQAGIIKKEHIKIHGF